MAIVIDRVVTRFIDVPITVTQFVTRYVTRYTSSPSLVEYAPPYPTYTAPWIREQQRLVQGATERVLGEIWRSTEEEYRRSMEEQHRESERRRSETQGAREAVAVWSERVPSGREARALAEQRLRKAERVLGEKPPSIEEKKKQESAAGESRFSAPGPGGVLNWRHTRAWALERAEKAKKLGIDQYQVPKESTKESTPVPSMSEYMQEMQLEQESFQKDLAYAENVPQQKTQTPPQRASGITRKALEEKERRLSKEHGSAAQRSDQQQQYDTSMLYLEEESSPQMEEDLAGLQSEAQVRQALQQMKQKLGEETKKIEETVERTEKEVKKLGKKMEREAQKAYNEAYNAMVEVNEQTKGQRITSQQYLQYETTSASKDMEKLQEVAKQRSEERRKKLEELQQAYRLMKRVANLMNLVKDTMARIVAAGASISPETYQQLHSFLTRVYSALSSAAILLATDPSEKTIKEVQQLINQVAPYIEKAHSLAMQLHVSEKEVKKLEKEPINKMHPGGWTEFLWGLKKVADYLSGSWLVNLGEKAYRQLEQEAQKVAKKNPMEAAFLQAAAWLARIGGYAGAVAQDVAVTVATGGAAAPLIVGATAASIGSSIAYSFTDPWQRKALSNFAKQLAEGNPQAFADLAIMIGAAALAHRIATSDILADTSASVLRSYLRALRRAEGAMARLRSELSSLPPRERAAIESVMSRIQSVIRRAEARIQQRIAELQKGVTEVEAEKVPEEQSVSVSLEPRTGRMRIVVHERGKLVPQGVRKVSGEEEFRYRAVRPLSPEEETTVKNIAPAPSEEEVGTSVEYLTEESELAQQVRTGEGEARFRRGVRVEAEAAKSLARTRSLGEVISELEKTNPSLAQELRQLLLTKGEKSGEVYVEIEKSTITPTGHEIARIELSPDKWVEIDLETGRIVKASRSMLSELEKLGRASREARERGIEELTRGEREQVRQATRLLEKSEQRLRELGGEEYLQEETSFEQLEEARYRLRQEMQGVEEELRRARSELERVRKQLEEISARENRGEHVPREEVERLLQEERRIKRRIDSLERRLMDLRARERAIGEYQLARAKSRIAGSRLRASEREARKAVGREGTPPEERLQELREQERYVERELGELRQRLSDAESRLRELEREKQSAEARVRELRSRLRDLERRYREAQSEQERLSIEREILRTRSELSRLQREVRYVESYERYVEELRSRVAKLERRLETIRRMAREAELETVLKRQGINVPEETYGPTEFPGEEPRAVPLTSEGAKQLAKELGIEERLRETRPLRSLEAPGTSEEQAIIARPLSRVAIATRERSVVAERGRGLALWREGEEPEYLPGSEYREVMVVGPEGRYYRRLEIEIPRREVPKVLRWIRERGRVRGEGEEEQPPSTVIRIRSEGGEEEGTTGSAETGEGGGESQVQRMIQEIVRQFRRRSRIPFIREPRKLAPSIMLIPAVLPSIAAETGESKGQRKGGKGEKGGAATPGGTTAPQQAPSQAPSQQPQQSTQGGGGGTGTTSTSTTSTATTSGTSTGSASQRAGSGGGSGTTTSSTTSTTHNVPEHSREPGETPKHGKKKRHRTEPHIRTPPAPPSPKTVPKPGEKHSPKHKHKHKHHHEQEPGTKHRQKHHPRTSPSPKQKHGTHHHEKRKHGHEPKNKHQPKHSHSHKGKSKEKPPKHHEKHPPKQKKSPSTTPSPSPQPSPPSPVPSPAPPKQVPKPVPQPPPPVPIVIPKPVPRTVVPPQPVPKTTPTPTTTPTTTTTPQPSPTQQPQNVVTIPVTIPLNLFRVVWVPATSQLTTTPQAPPPGPVPRAPPVATPAPPPAPPPAAPAAWRVFGGYRAPVRGIQLETVEL